jgi:AraC-like DNA-binding protein
MAKRATLSTVRQIATLRAAGYSISTIAERIGMSARTVARICAKFDIRKSDFRREAIETARRELLRDAGSVEYFKSELAALVLDDIAQARRLRDKIANTAEYLEPTDIDTAVQAARAISALATSLKMLRDLDLRKLVEQHDDDNPPELVIRSMTLEEIEKERKRAATSELFEDEPEEVET